MNRFDKIVQYISFGDISINIRGVVLKHADLDKIIVNSENFICYIADKDTYEIIYANKTLRNLVGVNSDEDCVGKKCYQIFQNLDEPCAHCANDSLVPGQNIHRKLFVHLTQSNYVLIDSLILIDDKYQRFTVAYNNNLEHAQTEEISQKLTLESTLLKCVNTLREENTLEEAINNLLQVVGGYYNADRTYLSEIKELESVLLQTFEWCSSPEYDNRCKNMTISLEDLEATIDILTNDGHLVIVDIEKERDKHPSFYKILKNFNTRSILLMPLFTNGKVSAIMGVDNPRIMPEKLDLLRSVSIFVNDDIRKRNSKKELERLSYIDNLTGLYNRNKYIARLEEIDTANLSSVGILNININGLKQINELYREDYGDYIIKEVANILLNYVDDDIFRLSGDEFVAFCHNISQKDFENIINLLRRNDTERQEFSFAVGGIWQDKNIDLRLGVNQAGDIMLAEKQSYYKEKPLNEIQSRTNPLSILLDEIEQGYFFICLQPKVELLSEKIIGAEALIRKRDRNGKIVPPDKFIPIYEYEGTIRHVDFFVFKQVCILLQELIAENKPIKIAVNFSRVTFMAYDIVDEMIRTCEAYSVPHEYIKIEITESIDKLNFEFFEKKLRAIRKAGFDVSLDDFGAKHSNLLMLSMIDFTEIKIDKSLIDNMTTRSKNRTVVRNIIKTISELGSSLCLAEGIETEEQKIALQEIGCHYGQGYYFYRPMNVEDFAKISGKYSESNEIVIPKKDVSELYFTGHSKEISALIDANPLCMALFNHENRAVLCNQQVMNIFDLTEREEFSSDFFKFSPKIQPNDRLSRTAFLNNMNQAREKGYLKFNWLHCDVNGNEIPTQIVLEKLNIMDNESKPYLAAFIKDLRPQLAGTEDGDWADGYFYDVISDKTLFNSIADMSVGWFFALDLRTSNIQFFGKGKEILHLPSTKLLYPDSLDIKSLVHSDDLEFFYESYNKILQGIDEAWDVRLHMPSGETRYYRTVYQTFFDSDENPIFCIGRTFDIHDEKMLEILSQTDLLTNCFNKVTTENLIRQTLKTKDNAHHAMFIFDIDNFKTINDTLGHDIGDRVLIEIAQNLQSHFRDHDIIGRIGGDEFVVFLKNTQSRELVEKKAEMIIEAFKKANFGDEIQLQISGSIGISLYPTDGSTYEELYKAADKALYQSKLRGKNCYTFFSGKTKGSSPSDAARKFENAGRIANSYLDFELTFLAFETLFNHKDSLLAIHEVLKLISEKFNADRVYLLKTIDKGMFNSLVCEYTSHGLGLVKDVITSTTADILGELFQAFYDNEILYFNDTDVIENKPLYEMMQKQNVKTVLLLETKGKGYPGLVIGLDDCKNYRLWTEKQVNSLKHIVKLLSIFLASSDNEC